MAHVTLEEAKTEALARFKDRGPDHYNCAQAVVYFALLAQGRDPDYATLARYLGGGVAGMGEICGAVSGTALALGLRDLYLDEVAEEIQARTQVRLQEILGEFAREFGALRCADLTGCDLRTPESHGEFLASGADERCPLFVGWMCDQLAPLLMDPENG